MDDVDDDAWPSWAAGLSAILKLQLQSGYSRRECRRDPRDGKARDMVDVCKIEQGDTSNETEFQEEVAGFRFDAKNSRNISGPLLLRQVGRGAERLLSTLLDSVQPWLCKVGGPLCKTMSCDACLPEDCRSRRGAAQIDAFAKGSD